VKTQSCEMQIQSNYDLLISDIHQSPQNFCEDNDQFYLLRKSEDKIVIVEVLVWNFGVGIEG
jgi:hypothetical protein